MAWLEQDLKSRKFKICFRFAGRRFKKTLGTSNRKEADTIAGGVEKNLLRLEQGLVDVPPDADLLSFVLSDGRRTEKPVVQKGTTLKDLFQKYHDLLPPDSLETNSISTMKTHERHFIRHLGKRFEVRKISLAHLQQYVEFRSREKGNSGQPISPVTIKKEITSLSAVWNWGVRMGLLEVPLPNRCLIYPKVQEKPPFQTWKEIERVIEIRGLNRGQAKSLWDCLFLTLFEIDELLEFIKANARHRFVYPMAAFAAHTGARRSELIRSQLCDIDIATRVAIIREKKRHRGKHTTRRVPLSPLLTDILQNWLAKHPGGLATFTLGSGIAGNDRNDAMSFVLTKDETHHHLKKTLAGSKWEKIRGWHVFRHSFCSNCAAQGVDQRVINSWVGHQTEEMVKRYRHLLPDQQQRAIQLVFGNGE